MASYYLSLYRLSMSSSYLLPFINLPPPVYASFPNCTTKNSLKSFDTLQVKFDLSISALYQYNSISSFLSKHPPPSLYLPGPLWQFLSSPHTKIKGISLFYNLLQNKLSFYKTKHMLAWEEELGDSFSDVQWQSAIRRTYRAFKCVTRWEQSQKSSPDGTSCLIAYLNFINNWTHSVGTAADMCVPSITYSGSV